MSKQLLIYEQAIPVSKTNHNDLYVKTGDDYGFAKNVNSIPITAVEFAHAALDYPIVFAGKDDEFASVAIMGVRENENLFISKEGKVIGRYIPAFLRRYPFVFSSNDKGANFTLCIDESFGGCNREGKGERLFDETVHRLCIQIVYWVFSKNTNLTLHGQKRFVKNLSNTIYLSQ